MTYLTRMFAAEDTIHGYVYHGNERSEHWFKGTPENIASYLMRNQTASQITLTDKLDRLVLRSFGSLMDICAGQQLMTDVLEHLVPMQKGEQSPVAVELIAPDELNKGYPETIPATFLFRYDEDDFGSWYLDLPTSVADQFKQGRHVSADSIEELMKKMPTLDEQPGNELNLLIWDRNEISLYSAPISADFLERHEFDGCSMRADLVGVVEDLDAPEYEINIMWDDLKPETQDRLMRMLGDNGNYDINPITTIYAPDIEQGMQMQ